MPINVRNFAKQPNFGIRLIPKGSLPGIFFSLRPDPNFFYNVNCPLSCETSPAYQLRDFDSSIQLTSVNTITRLCFSAFCDLHNEGRGDTTIISRLPHVQYTPRTLPWELTRQAALRSVERHGQVILFFFYVTA